MRDEIISFEKKNHIQKLKISTPTDKTPMECYSIINIEQITSRWLFCVHLKYDTGIVWQVNVFFHIQWKFEEQYECELLRINTTVFIYTHVRYTATVLFFRNVCGIFTHMFNHTFWFVLRLNVFWVSKFSWNF